MYLSRIIKFRKYAIILMGICLILWPFVPIYSTYIPLEYDPYWKDITLFEDEELLLFAFPIYVLFPVYVFLKKGISRFMVKFILLLPAGIFLLLGLASTGFTGPDYIPLDGTIFDFVIPIGLVVLFYCDWEINIAMDKAAKKTSGPSVRTP